MPGGGVERFEQTVARVDELFERDQQSLTHEQTADRALDVLAASSRVDTRHIRAASLDE
jgi:hypothetical protein